MHQVEPESVEVECAFCHHMLKITPQDLLGVLSCPACKALIEVEPEAQRPTVRFDCPECGSGVDVPLEHSRESVRCPHCACDVRPSYVEVSWEKARRWIRVGLPTFMSQVRRACTQYLERRRAQRAAIDRRRQEEYARRQRGLVAQQRQREIYVQNQETYRQRCLVAQQRQREIQLQREVHCQAVLSGQVFDVVILVEAFKEDWLQVSENLELNPLKVDHRVKAASPVTGVGAGWATGNVWVGLAVGIATFLASGPIADAYAAEKFQEWRAKWRRILANRSQQEMAVFLEKLHETYPMIFRELMASQGTYLPAP